MSNGAEVPEIKRGPGGRAGAEAATPVPAALARLEAWIEAEEFRGWDPYDALTSPILAPLARGPRVPAMIVVQLLKRSPVNLRPLLRIPKRHNAKGMALFVSSYLRRWWTDGDEACRTRVGFLAEWLRTNVSPGYAGAAWGYPFPWPNRGFFAPEGTPTIVNTAFVGLALLEAGDVTTARSACDFVLRDLNTLSPAPDELCFSYTPGDERWVYNASLLGAELLAATGAHTDEAELADAARRAANFVVRRQRPDGAWAYGEDAKLDDWVDNFHTGFVLGSLRRIGAHLGTAEYDTAVNDGYAFWKRTMFRADGAPRYYAGVDGTIDIHAVAQSVLTFLDFADRDATAAAGARRTARWGIENMQNADGSFYYQLRRGYAVKIPYMRWSQAWMQRALRELVWHDAGRPVRTVTENAKANR